ncbi:MAG: YchJ family metal-binding protein [Cyanobium sp. LacPavin_0818_WC50_MAG_67_9]|nr:YchJ family metal-binding protein [Cyanobium sp. LacPavin_0818_WC50_MAG_67_9]
MQNSCPCGGFLYASCCAPLHRGERQAVTAEQLMRSRYSAYALGEVEYLLQTQPSPVPLARRCRELLASLGQRHWQRLQIITVTAGGGDDLSGTVTFEAHYVAAGQRGVMRECSLFGRTGNSLDGGWLYLEALELA